MKKVFIKSFCFLAALLISVTTEKSLASEMNVPAGADLATVISENTEINAFLLEGAEYEVGDITFSRSITLSGAPGRTKITTTGSFLIQNGANISLLCFEEIDFVGSGGYVFNTSTSQAFDLNEISFNGCTFEGYQRSVFRVQNTGANVDYLIVNNCVFKNWASNADAYCIFQSSVDSKLGTFVIKNSTFANLVNVGIIRWGNYTGAMQVLVENCTFYGVGNAANADALFRFNAAANSEIHIINNIFAKSNNLSAAIEGIRFGSSSKVTVSNNYGTSDFMQTATTDRRIDLTAYSGASADLFVDPAEGNFAIKDAEFAGKETAGDPRWIKLSVPPVVVGSDADLATVITENPEASVFHLEGNEYTIENTITVSRSITLEGAVGRTKITTSSANVFEIENGAEIETILFEGIDFVSTSTVATRHLFFNTNTITFDLGSITFRDCTFDNYDNGQIFAARTAATVIGGVIIDNCIVKNMPNIGSNGIIYLDGALTLDNMVIKNSTFVNIGAFIVRAQAITTTILDVENCTFYDVGFGGILFRFSAATGDFTFSNCIFAKGKVTNVQMLATHADANKTITNNYKTSDFTLHANNQIDLIEYSGSSVDLFVNPTEGNLNIKDSSFEGKDTAGDPRWESESIDPDAVYVGSAENLSEAIEENPDKTVFRLQGAEYTIASTITLSRSITLIGAPDRTKITTTVQTAFTIGEDADIEAILIEGIDFVGSTGIADTDVFSTQGTVIFNLGSITFRDCTFDNYSRSVFRVQGSSSSDVINNSVDEIIFDNCIVKNMLVDRDGIIQAQAQTATKNVVLNNSTFYNIASYMMRLQRYTDAMIIDVTKCTFYDVGIPALFRFDNAQNSVITISDCIFAKSKVNNQQMVARHTTATLNLSNNYKTSDFEQHPTNNRIDLLEYSGSSVDLFVAPTAIPFDLSFKDPTFAGFEMVGDPRWKKEFIYVIEIALDKPTLELYVNDSETLTATIAPINATNKDVRWSSSDETVATVVNGIVTAVGAGTATITATTAEGGKTEECIVTVTIPGDVVILTLSVSPDGTGTASSDKTSYRAGDNATVTARNVSGYKFKEWQIGGTFVSAENPYTFQIEVDTEIVAIFEESDEIITIVKTQAEFVAAYKKAEDGEILLLEELEPYDLVLNPTQDEPTVRPNVDYYCGNGVTNSNVDSTHYLRWPVNKIITIKAAPGHKPKFRGFIGNAGTNASTYNAAGVDLDFKTEGGGIIFDGIEILADATFIIGGSPVGDIDIIAFRNCIIRRHDGILGGNGIIDIANAAATRPDDLQPNIPHIIGLIEIDNCILSDIGSNDQYYVRTNQLVKNVMVKNSTFYNARAAGLFTPNNGASANNTDVVLNFTFENNTVYRWGRFNSNNNPAAICNVRTNNGTVKYADANIIFRNNIIAEPFEFNASLNDRGTYAVNTHVGTVTAMNNLLIKNGGYLVNDEEEWWTSPTASTSTAILDNDADLKWEDLFPGIEPDAKTIFTEIVEASVDPPVDAVFDFTIDPSSPLVTAGVGEVGIGDPRWINGGNVMVKGVTLDRTTLNFAIGITEPQVLVATVSPNDAANKDVIWESSSVAVVTVDDTGRVTAVAVGTAIITVTTVDGGFKANCTVNVTADAVSVTGVSLKTTTELIVGDFETLIPTIEPAGATNQNVTWESSAPAVATVDATGKVTAVAVGTATITVTTEDGGFKANCAVTVNPKRVTGVTLNKSTTSILVGGFETLIPTVAPADATDKRVTWESSAPAVATVDNEGKVTGIAAGTAIITVISVDDITKTANCTVTVTQPVTGVSLNKTTLSLNVGNSEILEAIVAPSNATIQDVKWSSDDPTIATVNNGTVTAIAPGTATITVTTEDGSKTADCEVTVIQPVTGVSLSEAVINNLKAGETITLIATVAPGNASNKNVTWNSSDNQIATVDNDGNVTGVKAGGPIYITVTTVDGGKTASCVVTVTGGVTNVEISDALLAHMYPNPTDGLITLQFDTQNVYTVTITDLAGKVMLRQLIADQVAQLDISSYTAGVYMLVIDNGKQQTTMRIVKN